ncbi:hypothetical protein SLS58_010747 [Diplodia intermedia]|uniref:Nudix hydrolase domain-containing protein n=1 Tax=Diplodia intermedia TaxID=856260 RepID=A0ABR3T413_9PEZI
MSGDSFDLDFIQKDRLTVPVSLVKGLNEKQLLGMKAFTDWCKTLKKSLDQQNEENHDFHKSPYTLKAIKIESVNFFGARIGFLKFEATISNASKSVLPGVVFLRGGSVAVLMILRPRDRPNERLVIMTEQPRIPAGSLAFLEIPAGMLDDQDDFGGKAAEEIEEETGLKIHKRDLKNMTEMVINSAKNVTDEAQLNNETRVSTMEKLQDAMYPSPGGSDEYIPIFVWEKTLDRQQIQELKGKLSGDRRQGEMIRLRLIDYEDFWRIGARDAKALAAWALYESLKRSGDL